MRSATRPLTDPQMAPRAMRSAIVGEADDALRELLLDILAELTVTIPLPAAGRPDLVLAIVRRHDVPAVVADARRVGAGAPIAAILPFADEVLAKHALEEGAHACYAIQSSLASLGAGLLRLVTERSSVRPPTGEPTIEPFRIGRALRRELETLRRANHSGYHAPHVPDDAEARLERAIQLDAELAHLNARFAETLTPRRTTASVAVSPLPSSGFRFGVHARLEVTLMRLDAASVARLERAVQTDLAAS